MEFEEELCRDMLDAFAINVGSHNNTDQFNERLYIVKLLSLIEEIPVSIILDRSYCPADIRLYYKIHGTRIKMLDDYKFENFNDTDRSKFDCYVHMSFKSIDQFIKRFEDKSCKYLNTVPERVKIAVWSKLMSPKVKTVYEMDKLTSEMADDVVEQSDMTQICRSILQYTCLTN